MEEVRHEVQEATSRRITLQKMSTDSMATMLGDTGRDYPGAAAAHDEALARSAQKQWEVPDGAFEAAAAAVGAGATIADGEPAWQTVRFEGGEIVVEVPTSEAQFDEWLEWLHLKRATPETEKGVEEDRGGGGAANAVPGLVGLVQSASASAAAAATAAATAINPGGDRTATTDAANRWSECNQRIAYHFCHYKLAVTAITESHQAKRHFGFDPELRSDADRTMVVHKMLTEIRQFGEKVSQAAKQRIIRINRDVSIFSQQVNHVKDGMANVRNQLDQVLKFEGRTALGPPPAASGRGGQRKRPLKPRTQATREQKDHIDHATKVRAQCEKDRNSYSQQYLAQISQIVAKEPLKLVNSQISEAMDQMIHNVQRLLQRVVPITNERLQEIVDSDAFTKYFEYQSSCLIHHAKMLKRKMNERDATFTLLCSHTRVDPLLQAIKNTVGHMAQREADKAQTARTRAVQEAATREAGLVQELLLKDEIEAKAKADAKREKQQQKQADRLRERLETEAKAKLDKEAAVRAAEAAAAAKQAEEEALEQQRLEQRRRERLKEAKERREAEKQETDRALRSVTATAVSAFLNAVETGTSDTTFSIISETVGVAPPAHVETRDKVTDFLEAVQASALKANVIDKVKHTAGMPPGDGSWVEPKKGGKPLVAATPQAPVANGSAKRKGKGPSSKKEKKREAAAAAAAAAAANHDGPTNTDSSSKPTAGSDGASGSQPKQTVDREVIIASPPPAVVHEFRFGFQAAEQATAVGDGDALAAVVDRAAAEAGGAVADSIDAAAEVADAAMLLDPPPPYSPAADPSPALVQQGTVWEAMGGLFAHLAEVSTGSPAQSLAELNSYANDGTLQAMQAEMQQQPGVSGGMALELACERMCREQFDPYTHGNNQTQTASYPYCFAQGGQCCAHAALGMASEVQHPGQEQASRKCTVTFRVGGSDLLGLAAPVSPDAFLSLVARIHHGSAAKLVALPAAVLVSIEWTTDAHGTHPPYSAMVTGQRIAQTVDLHSVYGRWGPSALAEPSQYALAAVLCQAEDGYTLYHVAPAVADSWLKTGPGFGVDGSVSVGSWSDLLATLETATYSTRPVVLAYQPTA
jgi:hypothetical protein